MPCLVAAQADGSFVATGSFRNTATFGNFSLTSAGGIDIFVVCFSASGVVLWAKSFGGSSSHDHGLSIAAHADGSIVVSGDFMNSASFGAAGTVVAAGDPLNYRSDIFAMKMSASGVVLWCERFGGVDRDYGNGIAAHADGTTLVTGSFAGVASFGAAGNLTARGRNDVFIVKMSAGGVVLWAKSFGGAGTVKGVSIAAHADGSCTVAGTLTDTVTFATVANLSSAGYEDLFMASLSSSGVVKWAERYGTSGIDRAPPTRPTTASNTNKRLNFLMTGSLLL